MPAGLLVASESRCRVSRSEGVKLAPKCCDHKTHVTSWNASEKRRSSTKGIRRCILNFLRKTISNIEADFGTVCASLADDLILRHERRRPISALAGSERRACALRGWQASRQATDLGALRALKAGFVQQMELTPPVGLLNR